MKTHHHIVFGFTILILLLVLPTAAAAGSCKPLQIDSWDECFKRILREAERTVERIGREAGRTVERIGREAGRTVERIGREAGRTVEDAAETLDRTRREAERAAKMLAEELERAGREADRMVEDVVEEVERLDDNAERVGKEIERTAERIGREVGRTALSLRERFCEEVEKDILRAHKKGVKFEDCSEAPVGVRWDSGGGVSVTGGPGSPGIPIPGTAPDAGPSLLSGSTPERERGGGRAPATLVGLPNQVASIVWRLVRNQLTDGLVRDSLLEDLNAGEEELLDQLFAERIAEEVRQRTGLYPQEGAVSPGSRFRPHQEVIDDMVEQVLLDEEFRNWQAENPGQTGALHPAAPVCSSEPCIRAAPPK